MTLFQFSMYFLIGGDERDVIATKMFRSLEKAEDWFRSMEWISERFPEIHSKIERVTYVGDLNVVD